MKPEDLTKMWDAPDHSKLSQKQFSIRLPILANAKISAFCDMYPGRSKTAMINDLIITALDQVIEALPSKKGKLLNIDHGDEYEDSSLKDLIDPDVAESDSARGIYEDIGPKGQFLRLTERHLRKLEQEAKLKEKILVPKPIIYSDDGE